MVIVIKRLGELNHMYMPPSLSMILDRHDD